jgi:membrane-bound lytic murein transglycosylase
MPKTPEQREKYWQELEELEQKASGVFACITPERHKKRWEQKVVKLEQQLCAAETPQEKERLQQKLTQLNQAEQRKADLIAEVYSEVALAAQKNDQAERQLGNY